MSLITQRRIEYRQFSHGVNRHRTIAGFLGVLWGIGLLCCGCATVSEARRADFGIAVRYDVEPVLIGGDLARNEGAIRADFKAIAELGFGGVVLHHVEDGDRRKLLDLAGEAGLKAAVPDRRFDRFVVTGGLPPSCRGEDDLLREAPDEVIRHPAFDGYVLEGGRGPAARERSRRLRVRIARLGATSISVYENYTLSPSHSSHPSYSSYSSHPSYIRTPYLPHGDADDIPLAVINARVLREDPPGTAVERLLAEYHLALSEGRTGGVIVDRFARLPGDPPGLTSPDDPLLPAHSSAVAALIQRARCWGPRLNGLPATALDIEETKSSPLTVTALGVPPDTRLPPRGDRRADRGSDQATVGRADRRSDEPTEGRTSRPRREGPGGSGRVQAGASGRVRGQGEAVPDFPLSRGARRFVLVFNTSKDRFVREEVRLPATILDRTVLRAVEFPPSTDRGAGRVIQSQHGELVFPVDLRPGDAMLFELFTSAH